MPRPPSARTTKARFSTRLVEIDLKRPAANCHAPRADTVGELIRAVVTPVSVIPPRHDRSRTLVRTESAATSPARDNRDCFFPPPRLVFSAAFFPDHRARLRKRNVVRFDRQRMEISADCQDVIEKISPKYPCLCRAAELEAARMYR